jgi:tyrosine-protein kinase Etk/Wzc
MNNESVLDQADSDEIDLLSLLQVVAENLRLLVVGPLLIGLAALGIAFVVPPTFTANTTFMPPQQQQGGAAMMLQSLGALGGLAGAAAGIKNPNDQYLSLMKSETVGNALVARFDLMNRYEAKNKTDTRKTLAANSRIASGKDGLITIEVDDKDPQVAADIANAYVEELRTLLGRLAVTEAQNRRVFFESQLQKSKEQLTRAEQALRGSGVNVSALKSNPVTAISGVAQMQAQITAQEVKIASMRGYLTESAPDFKQALTELAALRSQFSKLERPPQNDGADADYVARYRDFKYYETLFDLFAKQFELARVDEAREGAVIQIVDLAVPPEQKSKPKKALIAIVSTLASGFLILLFVFIRHAMRNSLRDSASSKKWNDLRVAFRNSVGLRT